MDSILANKIKLIFNYGRLSSCWEHKSGISIEIKTNFYNKEIKAVEKLGYELDFINPIWEDKTCVAVFKRAKKK